MHLRRRQGGKRPGQRHRPARLLHFPVRRRRQPLAAGSRHLHRRRGARVRPGRPFAHRGATARRLRALGGRRKVLARRPCGSSAGLVDTPPVLGGLRRCRAARAGPRAKRLRSRRPAASRAQRTRAPRPNRTRHPGWRRAGRPGAAHVEGRTCAALRRRHPVRRPRRARGPGLRPPRGQAHAGRQDRSRPGLQAGRHQRADGRVGAIRQARGAPQVRRPHGVRARRRGDRGTGARRYRASTSYPASRPPKAPRPRSRSRSPSAARHGACSSSPDMRATAGCPATSIWRR